MRWGRKQLSRGKGCLETEFGVRGRGKLTATVESHSACSDEIMLLNALFLDQLLGCHIACYEEK